MNFLSKKFLKITFALLFISIFTFSSIYAQVIWNSPSSCDNYGNRSISAKITNTSFATRGYKITVFKNGEPVHGSNKLNISHNATREIQLGGIPTGTSFDLHVERDNSIISTKPVYFGACSNRPPDIVSYQSPSGCDSNNNRSISVSIDNKSGYGRDYKITVHEGGRFIHGGLDEYIGSWTKRSIKLSGIPADGRTFEIRVERDGQIYKRKSYTFNICTSSDVIQFDSSPSDCDGNYNRSFGINVTNNGFAGNYEIVVYNGANEIHKTNSHKIPHRGNQKLVLGGIPTIGNLKICLEKNGVCKKSKYYTFEECTSESCNPTTIYTSQLQDIPMRYNCKVSYNNLDLYYDPINHSGTPLPEYNITKSKATAIVKLNYEVYEYYKTNWLIDLKEITNDPAGVYTKGNNGKVRVVLGSPKLLPRPNFNFEIPPVSLDRVPAYSSRELIQFDKKSLFDDEILVFHEMFHQYQWAYFEPVGDVYFNNSGFFESMAQYAAYKANSRKPSSKAAYVEKLEKSDQDPWDPNYSGSIFFEWLVDEYFGGDEFNMYHTLLNTAKEVKGNRFAIPFIPLPIDFEGLDVAAVKQAVNDDFYVHKYRNWTLTNSLSGISAAAKRATGYTYDLINNTSAKRKTDINTGHAKIYKIRHLSGQKINIDLSNQNSKEVYVSIVTNANSINNPPITYRMINNTYFNIGLGNNTVSYIVVSPSIEDGNQDDIEVEITRISSLKQNIDNKDFVATNYPNPFKGKTSIAFNLESESDVSLKIYNTAGVEISTLLDKVKYQKGKNTVIFDGTAYPSGIYYYSLQSNDSIDMQKMILLE